MSVIVNQWRWKIGSFNNRVASNVLFCTYNFNKVYKILLPVFSFLFVVILCVFYRKCLNTLLKFSPKHQFGKIRLEFHHRLLSYLYLVKLSKYLTCCITIILLSGDVEINSGPKSSSRGCFSECY